MFAKVNNEEWKAKKKRYILSAFLMKFDMSFSRHNIKIIIKVKI